ncbi:MAG TPA: enoyl-CoA hydratase-related protein [Solirubrobacterales bacterium]|nr:enoyl-CoA hydratase-related protein [Solirubrobacterales bacterium]
MSASTLVSQSTLVVETRGHVAWWTLNRPHEMNALNADLFARLAAAAEQAKADPEVRVVVIRGTGERAFSAGADLDELDGSSREEAEVILARGGAVMSSIERLGKPVIAAVDGYALGGGLELALACTLVLVSDNASLGLPEVRLGLIPGYGGTQRLPRAIGRQAALQMMLSGEQISAREAWDLGLSARPPIPAEELDEAAEALAGELAGNGPEALGRVLQAVAGGAELGPEEALARETGLAAEACASEESTEGVAAFRERRKPEFRGS